MLRYAFLGRLPEAPRRIKESPAVMSIALIFLAILCTGMGLLLVPVLREMILDPAVDALARGVAYAQLLAKF